ncbi:DUF642 domain-containing protein [Nocardia panacis]|uniref:DUF642 domain-containing protein n=1 Tax=Nocardia panacis TaxID=2340916 RepID=A0A3A4K2P3_9NOCA|nr:DUF642 domain-containing protein [Nocardia panacis]RJO70714.1 DUF642 domain-containing protein [Nocardia panacis]
MTKQSGGTATQARKQEFIANFIQDGEFNNPAIGDSEAKPYRVIKGPENLGQWQVEGTAVLYGRKLTEEKHQALDIGSATLTQEFSAPQGRKVEITWKHSINTDPECQGQGSQEYDVVVLDSDQKEIISRSYQPHSKSFATAPNPLWFEVRDAGSYTIQFQGRTSKACGPLIYQVVGKAAE